MSRAHHSGAQPSQRMLRVGELIRHIMAELLSRGGAPDPALEKRVITVPEVRMSPDLKLANVYVMPLGGGDVGPVIAALDKQKKFFRTELAHKINLKFAPDLKFRPDESFEKSARIDALLALPVVQRDLKSDDESHD
ncbi:MAG: 30S ribosome-binding factor RbfA [Janthinobacterium lividum]